MLLPQVYEYRGFTMVYGTESNINGELILWDMMPSMERNETVVTKEDDVRELISELKASFEKIIDKHLGAMYNAFVNTGRRPTNNTK